MRLPWRRDTCRFLLAGQQLSYGPSDAEVYGTIDLAHITDVASDDDDNVCGEW